MRTSCIILFVFLAIQSVFDFFLRLLKFRYTFLSTLMTILMKSYKVNLKPFAFPLVPIIFYQYAFQRSFFLLIILYLIQKVSSFHILKSVHFRPCRVFIVPYLAYEIHVLHWSITIPTLRFDFVHILLIIRLNCIHHYGLFLAFLLLILMLTHILLLFVNHYLLRVLHLR